MLAQPAWTKLPWSLAIRPKISMVEWSQHIHATIVSVRSL